MSPRDHGRLNTYVTHRCRCVPCTGASREYERTRRRLRAYGRLPQLVAVEELVTHLGWLSVHGIGWEQVAALTGLSRSTVSAILYPDHPRRGVTPRIAAAILAILPTMDNAAEAALIDSAGTRRRLGALMLQGHTLTAIQTAIGVAALGRVLTRDRVTARVARAVRDFYDIHWDTPAVPADAHAAGVIARTIARAQADGHLPAMAWDDDLIDDPASTPDTAASRPAPRGARIHLEDVEFLAEHGATWEEIEARTGACRNSIEVSCGRADRRDLVARISSNRRVAA